MLPGFLSCRIQNRFLRCIGCALITSQKDACGGLERPVNGLSPYALKAQDRAPTVTDNKLEW
jgi:hypothetical protein